MKRSGFSQYNSSGALKVFTSTPPAPILGSSTLLLEFDESNNELNSLFNGLPTLPPFFHTTVATLVTGAQNNYAPGLIGDTTEFWSGASDATFSGLTPGNIGQYYTLKNTGTKVAYFLHQSGLSNAGNKFTNIITVGNGTPVAAGGHITYQYDGTNWQLIDHEQGIFISVAFSAGNFTANAGTWTVASGNQTAFRYKVDGGRLTVIFSIENTSVAGGPVQLFIAIPNAFQALSLLFGQGINSDAGAADAIGIVIVKNTSAFKIENLKVGFGAFGASTNTTSVYGTVTSDIL